ncbi:putative camphor 5-monooxygenase [Frankia canadensis]|uniref:Putative camphor 5-monooxygenase n=1 Tax=Frankia canadensis TaxID=1836972 RepID=A0A2I2KRT1_9ACTN|nr:cytochrome P450 [Frankia canadensis]SNQ48346.1 putative camphor 5-monooxygenase [Frankia canadensis]SOU55636.1 putative camphor 5-monooxygenase [Frankia canadensis]
MALPRPQDAPPIPATPEQRAAHWSLYAPWLQDDPVSYWKEMRENQPIVRSQELGGYWILTRYEDIEWAARNPQLFSSAQVGIPHRTIFPEKQIPIQLDGDEHRSWRQTLAELFNPSMVNHFTPAIRQAAAEAADALVGRDSCDFIAEFATALPAETFLITFGIGREHLQTLLAHKTWLRREGIPNARTDEDIVDANRPLREFFADAIERLRASGIEGRRDVLSQLLRSRHDGRELTQDEMTNVAFVTMGASLDTTTASLGLQFLHLAEHPEVRRAVAAAPPDRIPVIVEELLRHEPVSSTGRILTQDVERHGMLLRRGDRVLLSWGMAGLDPRVFDHPDDVDFDRPSTRHLGFGVGPHRCLGMHLARRVITIAMQEWHARFPEYRVDPDAPLIRHYSPGRGLMALGLRLDAPPAGGPAVAGTDPRDPR